MKPRVIFACAVISLLVFFAFGMGPYFLFRKTWDAYQVGQFQEAMGGWGYSVYYFLGVVGVWRLLYVFGILGLAIALAAILKRTYHLVWIALFASIVLVYTSPFLFACIDAVVDALE